MSTLAETVADVHWFTNHQGMHCVGCGWLPDRRFEDSGHRERRHVAETVELLVREQVGSAIADLDGLAAAQVARNQPDLTTLAGVLTARAAANRYLTELEQRLITIVTAPPAG